MTPKPRASRQMKSVGLRLETCERFMGQPERISETIGTYRKHGWRLARVLLCPETLALITEREREIFEDAAVKEAVVDALWFSRPSHAGREAWELRLVAETPYALFETFEVDEAEEDREEVRLEMEARLREQAARFPVIPRPS